MFEALTPYLDSILIALASGALGIIAYAKLVVKKSITNITPEEAQEIALQIVAALGDGVLTTEEKKNIIVKIITSCKQK